MRGIIGAAIALSAMGEDPMFSSRGFTDPRPPVKRKKKPADPAKKARRLAQKRARATSRRGSK